MSLLDALLLDPVKVNENIIDATVGRPLVQNSSGILEYFDNESPGGALLQGFDEVTLAKQDELTTDVEDVFLMSI